jgi:photosystem II stability/assembly factor-like uncharacterized protein
MKITFSLLAAIIIAVSIADAQQITTPSTTQLEQDLRAMRFRCVGPFRAGRSLAVASHTSDRNTYYFGTVGGGIFKSTDAGETWRDITDTNFLASSIGCITVAPSDPSVIYVGTGETDIRGNISPGHGMYRSTDAGQTWKNIGLNEGRMFADIIVHPHDANWVMVSAMGRVFGTNADRGIFKSTDGGATWRKVLFRNDSTGGMTLKMDPTNPRIIYASLWQAYRNGWSLSSGGSGSGLFKSTDAGETWTEITKNPGLPKGIIGKICVDVSRVRPGLVWAMVENENGGLFKSIDAGRTWGRASSDASIRQRPWYFSHVYADPKDEDIVYVLNVQMHKSIDGGKTFRVMGTNHADHHDMWIDPADAQRMIIGNDGGAVVSHDGGDHWTDDHMATAQFYHVAVDDHFPYRLYGAQQDNTTVSTPSRVIGDWSIDRSAWYSVAGFESGYVVPHPSDPNITVGGNYSGYLGWQDRSIDQERDISVYPNNPIGEGSKDRGERFQWTFPILFSPHDPSVLYTTSQHVWRSTDNGLSWSRISKDLTKNDTTKQVASGGPITKDNTGVEVYNTIFTFTESPVQKGILWAGSDDGLIHVSKDDGATWTKVTPPTPWKRTGIDTKLGPSDDALVSMIDASPFDAATAYAAVNRYKLDDEEPYIFRTRDHGASWERINKGIPNGAFVRVVRADPFRKGLLYAGTERGLYVSFDDGATWSRLRLNLPLSPIHDLQIQRTEKDLVIATHGRSFWILDDLSLLHQYRGSVDRPRLYHPQHSYRVEGGSWHDEAMEVGENAPNGVRIYYALPDTTSTEITLTLRNAVGDSIITFSSEKDPKGEDFKVDRSFHVDSLHRPSHHALTKLRGLNRFVWNMRYPGAEELEGGLMWGGTTAGPKTMPGTYTATLAVGKDTASVEFEIRMDPRLKVSKDDLQQQFDFLMEVRDTLSAVHKTIKRLRTVTAQVASAKGRMKDLDTLLTKDATTLAKKISDTLTTIEGHLVQTKAKAFQDLLNYPVKLNNKIASLASVASSSDGRPTKQTIDLFGELAKVAWSHRSTLQEIESGLVAEFNAAVKALDLPAVLPEKEDGKK